MLLVIKDFQEFCELGLAMVHNASMPGVGTKMGTVPFPQIEALIRAATAFYCQS